jgi:hypothetical protein
MWSYTVTTSYEHGTNVASIDLASAERRTVANHNDFVGGALATIADRWHFETVSEPGAALKVTTSWKKGSTAPRRTLRTYELKPRTPAYVWGIVAVLVLVALAWLICRDFSGFYAAM